MSAALNSVAAPTAAGDLWVCGVCTYAENTRLFLLCEVCQSARPAATLTGGETAAAAADVITIDDDD